MEFCNDESIIEIEEFYKNVLNQAGVMIHISEIIDNRYLKVIWANNFYVENCGHDINERNEDLEKFYRQNYSPKDIPTVKKVIKKMNIDHQPYSGIYKFYGGSNKEFKWTYTNLRPYKFDNNGNITHVLLATVFLTDNNINPERLADLQKEVNKLKHQLSLSKLSKTETEVLKVLSQSMTESEIATRLNRSIHTIKTHIKNIKKKLNLKKNLELVKFALEAGIN